MNNLLRASAGRALALAFLAAPHLAFAETPDTPDAGPDVIVTADRLAKIAPPPASTASITAAQIDRTVNATNVEDTVKYLPSLLVRKRHIGDTQAPLATRTSGVGASARSLIYADGALLSSLIGNNNTSASPRWAMVSPQEIERIDVLYGPFSAAYPGNSIGAVLNITTRLPEHLEATATAGVSLDQFDQYGTHTTLPAFQIGATFGDRIGPLSVFASAAHVASNSQPLAYVTALATASVPGSGGYSDVNRTGQPIRVLGASGIEQQHQDFYKLKVALDVTSHLRLTYVGGLFLNDTNATAETYIGNAAGPVYTSAFSSNVYHYVERHWSHSLAAEGNAGRVDWQVIGTLYDFANDEQRIPSGTLPAASTGGAGAIVRLNGTGWYTVDAKAAWRVDAAGANTLSAGFHHDRYTLASNRYATSDWIAGSPGALTVASAGSTQTDALWAQDAWRIAPPLTLTVGGRYEWWKAYDGYNFSAAPALSVRQPGLSAARFSPKAALAYAPLPGWKATLSFGEAWRFPTVSELYQAVTTGTTLTSPNPNLRPERALSTELAIQRGDGDRYVRLSLFTESIRDALLSQSTLVPGTSAIASFVQNVDRVRTRGLELAFEQRDIVHRLDLSGSFTLVDPRITADAALPAAVGKRPPQVPVRKATIVATYRPTDAVSLTAAARYSSRSFGTIDNSDPVANTYQGFASYLVADVRAQFRVTPHWAMAVGVDNINNAKYFLFHPFPQRTFSAELTYRL